MSSKNESIFWKKKEYVSFVLSILVLFIHSYFAPTVLNDSFISLFNHKFSFFFSRSITRYAVPMFFMLSGISFFKGYNNEKYLTKIKSRIHTLVIPYLLWNTVWMLWEIFTSYSFIAKFSTGQPYPLTPASILKGIFFYNCNAPFWFILDLIIFEGCREQKRLDLRQFCHRFCDFFIGWYVISHNSVVELFVCVHIEVSGSG